MEQPALIRHLDTWAKYVARVGGGIIFVIAILVTINTLGRKYFGVTFSDAAEVAGYLFAIAVSFGFAFVLVRRQNVRIDSAYNLMPLRMRSVFDVISAICFFVVMVMLTRHAARLVFASWEGGSQSVSSMAFPLWIPQLAWAIGFVLLCIVSGIVTLYAIAALVRGQHDRVNRLVGIPSLGEEIEEFTEAPDRTQ
ncbi:TRAP transporter small permease subunit [Paracoccus versutus]|uniref:TRAP transporter small permease protein n=1 Tax=Paracoccus versutus TaxID=34007 RepID=A0A3D9XS79_PARVE|nr:TRAP transporter small permease [Paracoccus versutus]REF73297.1 TRAP-type mannitol/chloroaromatic compound transport system permease small subunit [Paracoccus versutus]WGR54678.1 TRAP transporter small permease [Paracoccus versutus]